MIYTPCTHTVNVMAVLRFTLSEDGVGVLRDALACLGKFSEEVSLEAKKDRVRCTPCHLLLSSLAETPSSPEAGFNRPQHIQVSICLRCLCREPLLFQLSLRRCCAESRQVLLQALQPGTSKGLLSGAAVLFLCVLI